MIGEFKFEGLREVGDRRPGGTQRKN